MRDHWKAAFCLLAGGGDAATGLSLIAVPAMVLRFLAPARPEGDLQFLRFIGVFVACVGGAYLYPWLVRDPVRRDRRVRAAIEMTAGVRLAVSLFLGLAVASRAMELPWLAVGLYDALLAVAQLVLLHRGRFGDEV